MWLESKLIELGMVGEEQQRYKISFGESVAAEGRTSALDPRCGPPDVCSALTWLALCGGLLECST